MFGNMKLNVWALVVFRIRSVVRSKVQVPVWSPTVTTQELICWLSCCTRLSSVTPNVPLLSAWQPRMSGLQAATGYPTCTAPVDWLVTMARRYTPPAAVAEDNPLPGEDLTLVCVYNPDTRD